MTGLRESAALGVVLLVFAGCGFAQSASFPDAGTEGAGRYGPGQSSEAQDVTFADAMWHGAASTQAGRFSEASQHYEAAVRFDPGSTLARLALGRSLAYEVIPNLDTPENYAHAARAIEALRQLPETAPEFIQALGLIAAVQRDVKQLDDSKATELELLKLDPNHAEAHYSLGVIDWQQAYKAAVTLLARYGLSDDGAGNKQLNASACPELAAANAGLVRDGIDHLRRAIELKPSYDDAMVYLNLVYRRQADLACGDEGAREQALAQAEQWSARAMEVRSANTASRLPAR